MKTGMKLTKENYVNGAIWCNENHARINPETHVIEPIPALTAEQQKDAVRLIRDRYLKDTDKYMLPDYPTTEAEKARIRRYRQYLRDIPGQTDFPNVEVILLNEWK